MDQVLLRDVPIQKDFEIAHLLRVENMELKETKTHKHYLSMDLGDSTKSLKWCKKWDSSPDEYQKLKEKKVLFEWKVTDCPANPDQHEVAVFIYGNWSVFKIAYAAKVKELTPEVRDKWIKAFSEAKVVPKGFGRSRGSGN